MRWFADARWDVRAEGHQELLKIRFSAERLSKAQRGVNVRRSSGRTVDRQGQMPGLAPAYTFSCPEGLGASVNPTTIQITAQAATDMRSIELLKTV